MEWFDRRTAYIADLLKQDIWGPIGAAFPFVWSPFQFAIDNWADTPVQQMLRPANMMPAAWWIAVSFIVLFFWALETSYQRQAPTLRVFFGDPRFGVAWERAPNPPAIAKPLIHRLILTIKNGRSSKLDECQVQIRVKNSITLGLETINFYVSRPFSLRPDEQEQIHLLSYEFDEQRPGLSISKFQKHEYGQWMKDDVSLTLIPGTHHITVEVLSAQSKIARTHFTAKYTDRWHFYQKGKELLG